MTAVIDLDSVAYTIANPNKVLDDNGEPVKVDGKFVTTAKTEEQLLESTHEVMDNILTKCNAESHISFIKGKASQPSFRKTLNPTYKANRTKETPAWWSIVAQELVDSYGAIVIEDEYEVDDYVNATRYILPKSFIVAIDKDLLNLTGTHYNWKKEEWITVEMWQEEYWFWRDMITGQPGDNIKGLPKRGEVYATKMLDYVEGSLRGKVLDLYVEHFGEIFGVAEFAKNYASLKILDVIPGFVPPSPIMFHSSPASFDLSTVI